MKKQNFLLAYIRVVVFYLGKPSKKKNGPKRPRGLQFCNMVIGHALGSVQVLHQQKYP